MYKLCFFVPEEHAEPVKQAIFASGAGHIGHYDSCCWETPGVGQFRALSGSEPFFGEQGQVEKVTELKVEMVCADDNIKAAVTALRHTHPYEEPAFEVWKIEDF